MKRAVSPVDEGRVRQAVAVLVRGGLVAFPTETVYGLAADADQDAAVGAIFEAKGRPRDHPLIVHVTGIEAAAAWVREIPPAAQALMQHFWPGPLTLVLPRAARAHDLLTGGQDTVGLRAPAGSWAQALLRGLCEARQDRAAALAAPSANRYGRISPTSAEHVRADLGEKPTGLVDCILDGGSCALGIESTIVDFVGGLPRILRPGLIRADQIGALLRLGVRTAGDDADAPRASGRLAAHYAPRKPLQLLPTQDLMARVVALPARSQAVLAPPGLLPALAGVPCALVLRAPVAAPVYARQLYDNLRRLDASMARFLLVASPPQGAAWDAVHDRLRRAAAGGAAPRFDPD